jgi:hypothetical protein
MHARERLGKGGLSLVKSFIKNAFTKAYEIFLQFGKTGKVFDGVPH